MKVYLDTSALNRIFDDQTQPRIFLEASSILLIFMWIESRVLQIVSSGALVYENARNPYRERRVFANSVLKKSKDFCQVDDTILQRGKEIEREGIRGLDALHLACAERMQVEAFITCDDRILRKYRGGVRVKSPVSFTMEFVQEQQNEKS
jgi:predicted nucleic acid-binding protein